MKKIQTILLALIIIGIVMIFTQKFWVDNLVNFILEQSKENVSKNDPLNATYTVEDKKFTLVNGKAEKEIQPGSASKEIVAIFGEPVYGDLNNDGVNDAAMFLTEQSGGSGMFYYIVEAINMVGVYKGTNAIFLGDRIAPQNINIQDGRAVANFAERMVNESFVVPPSVGKSVWVNLDSKNLKITE
jgi:hypothetical protein